MRSHRIIGKSFKNNYQFDILCYMSIVYGIDTDKPITELMVRDALIHCVAQAHCPFHPSGQLPPDFEQQYAAPLVKKAFSDSGGDFDHPTSDSIDRSIAQLIEFGRNFTDISTVEGYAQEIRNLLAKIR